MRATPEPMQAIVYERYGGAEVMTLREVDKPVPRAGEVRIAVQAASVNSWDWDLLHGTSLVRPSALLRPRLPILGCDIAGHVDAVGSGVTRLRAGDAVFGDISAAGWGGFAEYVCVAEDALARKSPAMSFEQAAATPQAGVLALQGLRLFGAIEPGQRLLINGAGGGVGTFAFQLAKTAGAQVTVVDSAAKLPMLRDLGADDAIDYEREDFAARSGRYHFALDVVGRRPPRKCLRALTADGIYVVVGGTVAHLLELLWLMPLVRLSSRRRVKLLMHVPERADLEELSARFERGELKPVIDSVCRLAEVPQAIERLGRGEVAGKVVIDVTGEA